MATHTKNTARKKASPRAAQTAARSAKKAVAKKTAVKKTAVKKTTVKKSAAKKVTAKKTKGATKQSTSSQSAIARLRELCLAFPEAHEVEAWGEPTFRVKNKIFAMHSSASSHHGQGRAGIWINSDHVTQDMLLRAKPTHYFRPPYVGPSGWVGAWIDGKPNWSEIAELLRDGYRKRAPKKLAARLDDE